MLGIIGVMALIAVLGYAAPASAKTLCKVRKDPCPGGSAYPKGTIFKVELQELTDIEMGSNFKSKCPKGTGTMETLEEYGAPLLATATSFAYSECSGCTELAVLHQPYKAEITSAEPEGNGVVTLSSSGSGSPSFKQSGCPFGTTCTFGAASLKLDLIGGEGGEPAKAAVLLAKEEPLEKEAGGALCGTKATLDQILEYREATEPGQKPVKNPTVFTAQKP
jgi:hypothetical protein